VSKNSFLFNAYAFLSKTGEEDLPIVTFLHGAL